MAKRGNLSKTAKAESDERPIRFKRYKYLFLIVCEDQKTEPDYFETFKIQIPEESVFLKSVGTGKDPKGVVNSAITERNKLASISKRDVDEVWVVFDKDDAHENPTKIKNFEDAFDTAVAENINIAYSNEVFELWLLLYFTDIDKNTPLPRKTVYEMLQSEIRKIPKYDAYIYDHKRPVKKTIETRSALSN